MRTLTILSILAAFVLAATTVGAQQFTNNDGTPEVTLEPGSGLVVHCETELRANPVNGSYHLECDPLPEPAPEPTAEPTPEPEPDDPSGPLLSDFSITAGSLGRFSHLEASFVAGLQQAAPHGTRTVTDPGPYANWDVLLTDQGGHVNDPVRLLTTNNWITLRLSRPATVVVVWQANEPLPAWLSGWEHKGSPVVIQDSQSAKPRQVLERTFGAGDVVLGGVNGAGETAQNRSPYYVVMQATDAGETPSTDPGDGDGGDGHGGHQDPNILATAPWSAPPLTLVNTAELEQPVSGQKCPGWVSRKYVTQAPDGLYYLTWHPSVDAEHGCYFGYEHGSNPARVPGSKPPPFAYGAPDHIHESFYGYKVKALDNKDGVMVLATTHFGTAEPHKAVCQQFHWNNFQFVKNGELVADIYLMGDFGAARKNDTNQPLDRECEHQRTGEVVNQHQLSQQSHGVRLNPVCTGPSNADCAPFYYPWRMAAPGAGEALGFYSFAYTVNTPVVVAACADMTCQDRRMIGGTGAWAFVRFDAGFGVRDPGHSADGVFYTNVYGDELRGPNDPDAVRQYVKPGADIRLSPLSLNHNWFPDRRYGDGKRGDYTYTQMPNGDSNILGSVRNDVDPEGYITDLN